MHSRRQLRKHIIDHSIVQGATLQWFSQFLPWQVPDVKSKQHTVQFLHFTRVCPRPLSRNSQTATVRMKCRHSSAYGVFRCIATSLCYPPLPSRVSILQRELECRLIGISFPNTASAFLYPSRVIPADKPQDTRYPPLKYRIHAQMPCPAAFLTS